MSVGVIAKKSRCGIRVENRLGKKEIDPGFEFSVEIFYLPLCILGCEVQGSPDEEGSRLADLGSSVVQAEIEAALDQLDQTRRDEVIIIHGFGVIADCGRIAHNNKNVADAQRMGSEQVTLDAQQIATSGRKVQGGVDPNPEIDEAADRPGAHSHPGHRAVSDVDHICAGLPSKLAPAISLWVESPRGGSISTEMTNRPSASF